MAHDSKPTGLPPTLPPLRAEVEIQPGGTDFNHTPTWVLHDPHANRFFHIGWAEYQLLSRWQLSAPQALIDSVNRETTLTIGEKEVIGLLNFLQQSRLLKSGYQMLHTQAEQEAKQGSRRNMLWMIRNYLFFRIPLVHPDRFLERTKHRVAWIFTKQTGYFMGLLLLVGSYLVMRQWDQFVNSLMQVFTLTGVLGLGIALIVSKALHELGHAYRCKLFGIRVPAMGVAFMVMWPLLYTDTGESWRLESPRKRLMISIAGLQIELYLAVLATSLWPFLPDGVLRSIVFYLGTASWMISLLVNISPFLRFDGYHVLSDLLGVRNLQPRSFLMAKWWLRRFLFGLNLPTPEPLSVRQRRIFVIYAVLTWLYRFFLFLGIALLVYFFFFKTLGVLLMLVEVAVFIIGPIAKEVRTWWQLREQFHWNRHTVISSGMLVFFLAMWVVPWQARVRIPAIWSYPKQALFAPQAAQVDQVLVRFGQAVELGDPLIRLHSAKLEFDTLYIEQTIKKLENQLRSISARQETLEDEHVLQEKLAQAQVQLAGVRKRQAKLVVTAPFPGTVATLAPDLRHGLWLREAQYLMTLVNGASSRVEGFADRDARARIQPGATGRFIPANVSHDTVPGTVTVVDHQQTRAIPLGAKQTGIGTHKATQHVPIAAYHTGHLGGEIPVRVQGDRVLVPEHSIYRVLFLPSAVTPLRHIERGTLVLDAPARSWIVALFRQILSILVRESGF